MVVIIWATGCFLLLRGNPTVSDILSMTPAIYQTEIGSFIDV
jgi:hypothetical protein